MRRPRAFTLVLALFLSLLLMTFGFAFLGKRAAQYRGSLAAARTVQARALAMAGLEDARGKLEKDIDFPPPGAEDQTTFSYSEEVTDVDGNLVGSYTVILDNTWSRAPYRVLRVTSEGLLGPRDAPTGRVLVRAHIDLLDTDPDTQFRYLRFEDESSL